MNKKRRESIGNAETYLNIALEVVRTAKEEEQDVLDNTPENLQMSERYEAMEECVDCLEDAISSIEEAINYVERALA